MIKRKFNANRLIDARIYNNITGEDLANAIGVKKQAISQFENKKTSPEYATACKISEVLQFPMRYFYEDDVPMLQGNTYFRALFTSNKRELTSQRLKTKYVALVHNALSKYIDFRPYNIPDFEDTTDIPGLARKLRHFWGLGQEPIPDMVSLLERNGVIMSEFATDSKKIDAFSQYGEIDGVPYRCVVLGTEKGSFVRRQFSCAHELGHIVLHEKFEDLNNVSREEFRKREDEANMFAAEFLLPAEAFLTDLSVHANKLNRYVELKRKWRVSIAAMVYRAHELEAITDNQYQYLMRQISQKGWRQNEPLDEYMPLRHPKALKQAVNLLILNDILTGSQLLEEIGRSGVSLPKKVVDEILSLEPDTIVEDDIESNAKLIPFAQLKTSTQ